MDPIIKKGKYKWKTIKIKYIDEKQNKLHKQAEQEANSKAEEIRKEFETLLNKPHLLQVHSKQDILFNEYLKKLARKY